MAFGVTGDVLRIDGQLAVARAFGDKSFKDTSKVMSNQEVVDTIKSIKDKQAAAKELIEEAISKKSKEDISCIVVRFQ
ncbi:unnamed protein product [Arabis nemorensis]|uniref:PPM-type phosphatase domain-containing protein n=1 Tax=Arabis nemorensis TaxID=586526 RepID=A0A565CNE6_9BRAS|nr:unnamed protein product [Arabis nemorensis]